MVNTKLSTPKVLVSRTYKDVVEFAKIAINNHLFIDGWSLLEILQDCIYRPIDFTVALTTIDGKAVGVAVLEELQYCSVFVAPEFRMNGFGTMMLERLHVDNCCSCFVGEPQSRMLFEKFGMRIMEPFID